MSNATRGVLAEYLVAKAVVLSLDAVRHEWDAYDLKTLDGVKIEVKSAAYIQSWRQERFSRIQFSVRPTRGWDAETSVMQKDRTRHADVYVLALLAHQDQETIDPMDISQWQFFVLPRTFLDNRKRSQHSITLPSLEKLNFGPYPYEDLAGVIKAAAKGKPLHSD